MIRLSKSKFTTGLQCHRKLWWSHHERDAPELIPNAKLQALFDTGHEVGERARKHYPGGTLVELDFDVPGTFDAAVATTESLIRGGVETIYEASFRANGVFSAIDILRRVEGEWVLGEVKSTTSAKKQHVPDAAVQAWVARASGVDVRRVEVIHLNRAHRHPDVEPLFVASDVTESAEAFIPSIEGELRSQLKMLGGELPAVEVGDQCDSPYECPFRGRCSSAPPKNHVSQLNGVGNKRARKLEADGYSTIDDLPDDYPLSPVNQRIRRAVLEDVIVVEPGLGRELDQLDGPAAYLDFETIHPALPAWPGCAPFQQVPVQFSVHRRPVTGAGIGVEHEAFLADGADDPRPAMADALVRATQGYGRVFAYNARFEAGLIRQLAETAPALSDELTNLAGRLVDLLPIVRDHVGHAAFAGSFSLKAVAPALLGRGYEDLEVADGEAAASLLARHLLSPEAADGEPEEVRRKLLAYCERDTEALVELHDALRELARGDKS